MIQRHLAIYSLLLCTLFLTIAGSAHTLAFSFQPSVQTIQQGIPGLGIPGQQQDQPQQQQQPEVPPQQSPPPPSLPTPSPSIPQSPPPLASSPPEAVPQQQQQQGASEGIIARGIIDSLIFTPSTTWIATGSWIIGVNNGAVALVTANMTWYNDNGTASHTHELLNFRPVEVAAGEQGQQQQQSILVQPADNSVSLSGVVDVGTNHRIVWKDVQSTIDIKKGGKILAISLNDAQTNNHFGGRPIFGIVTSFIRCSDVPGPNMEVLPPCLNIPVLSPPPPPPPPIPPSPSASTAPLPSSSSSSPPPPPPQTNTTTAPVPVSPPPPSSAAPPSASNATGKSPFDVLGGG
jgi:hypothetical protein